MWTFGGHLTDIWRTFGGQVGTFDGHLMDIWRTGADRLGYNARQLADNWRTFRGHADNWWTIGSLLDQYDVSGESNAFLSLILICFA